MNDPFELGIDCTPQFKPSMISREHMPLLFRGVPESVKTYARELRDSKGWRIYTVDQVRGRCYYGNSRHDRIMGINGVITIPIWAIDKRDIGYRTWYIAHELSHAYTYGDNHGPRFMAKLQEICPPEFVHHELGYKPRNATAAGIRKPGEANFIDPFDLLG